MSKRTAREEADRVMDRNASAGWRGNALAVSLRDDLEALYLRGEAAGRERAAKVVEARAKHWSASFGLKSVLLEIRSLPPLPGDEA